MDGLLKKIWGDAIAFLERPRRMGWLDLLIIVGLAGLFFGLLDVASQWRGPHRPAVEIQLTPAALIEYSFFSLCRGLLAAKDRNPVSIPMVSHDIVVTMADRVAV